MKNSKPSLSSAPEKDHEKEKMKKNESRSSSRTSTTLKKKTFLFSPLLPFKFSLYRNF